MNDNVDKNQDVTLAELKKDMEFLKDGMQKITATLTVLQENYIKRTEIEEIRKSNNQVHKDLEKRITLAELGLEVFKTQVKTWGSAGIMAIGVMQYIISILTR